MDDDTVQLLDEVFEHFDMDTTEFDEAQTLSNTLDELHSLHTSISTYGLTPSLLAFADHDKILSSCIKEIPSLEAFLGNPEAFDKDAALEGITDTIKQVGSKFIAAAIGALNKLKGYCTSLLSMMKFSIGSIQKTAKSVEGKQFKDPKEDLAALAKPIARANAAMERVNNFGKGKDTKPSNEALLVQPTTVLSTFIGSLSKDKIMGLCSSNATKIESSTRGDFSRIDSLMKFMQRSEGATNPETVKRRSEVMKELSLERGYLAARGNAIRACETVARAVAARCH